MIKKVGILLVITMLLAFGYTKYKSFQFEHSFDPSLFDSKDIKQITALYGGKRLELYKYVWKGYAYYYTTRNLQTIYYSASIPWQIAGSLHTIIQDSQQPFILTEARFKMDGEKIAVAEVIITKDDGTSIKATFYRSSVGIFVVFEVHPKGKPVSITTRKLSKAGVYTLLGLITLIKSL